jgi:hypothetical protein
MTAHADGAPPDRLAAEQRLEATGLTQAMADLLRAAGRNPGQGVVTRDVHSARILAHRGFVTFGKDGDGWTTLTLTDAGRAALALIG